MWDEMTDTIRETDLGIRHKLKQIIAGCEVHNIDILAIQEHRLTSIEPINYSANRLEQTLNLHLDTLIRVFWQNFNN